jgi:RNA polymerase sigma-70 factor (ECF subfamily)
MLRITRHELPPATVLTLEGRLAEPWVCELERVCRALHPQLVRLDLARVVFVDPRGIELVGRLLSEGVSIESSSAFVDELLKPALAEAEARQRAALERGDAAACEALVRRHGPRALALARRLAGEPGAAERAFATACAAAFTSTASLRPAESLEAWLVRLCLRAALAARRATHTASADLTRLLPRFSGGTRRRDEADERFGALQLDANADHLPELAERVADALAGLPEDARALLLLCDGEHLSLAAAADALELDLPSARRRLHEARQALRLLVGRRLAARERVGA